MIKFIGDVIRAALVNYGAEKVKVIVEEIIDGPRYYASAQPTPVEPPRAAIEPAAQPTPDEAEMIESWAKLETWMKAHEAEIQSRANYHGLSPEEVAIILFQSATYYVGPGRDKAQTRRAQAARHLSETIRADREIDIGVFDWLVDQGFSEIASLNYYFGLDGP